MFSVEDDFGENDFLFFLPSPSYSLEIHFQQIIIRYKAIASYHLRSNSQQIIPVEFLGF
jgi:hypothetical protein